MSVTRPFDSSQGLYYKWSIVTMHLSCTVVKIWCLKDNGVTNLTFCGHVTSYVTWPFDCRGRLPIGGPWWPCVHLAPLWRYGASNGRHNGKGKGEGKGGGEREVEGKGKRKVKGRELKKSWTHGRTQGHSGDFILCLMLCIALDRQ